MRADEYREKALDELGESYPGLGTSDPVRVAKAQAYALLAIAEELAAQRRVSDADGQAVSR